ncbi:MAG: hypothetical protein AAB486_04225, partial [Patescibacteria group bacterium]
MGDTLVVLGNCAGEIWVNRKRAGIVAFGEAAGKLLPRLSFIAEAIHTTQAGGNIIFWRSGT